MKLWVVLGVRGLLRVLWGIGTGGDPICFIKDGRAILDCDFIKIIVDDEFVPVCGNGQERCRLFF